MCMIWKRWGWSLFTHQFVLLDKALRPLATSIYYLLSLDEPNGVFHMNKSAVRLTIGIMLYDRGNVTDVGIQTMHVLHQGRAEYTLITPGSPPRIERKVRTGYRGHRYVALQELEVELGLR